MARARGDWKDAGEKVDAAMSIHKGASTMDQRG